MNNYLKTADSDWYKQRLSGMAVCIIAVFALLIIKLFYLQLIKGDEYRHLSDNNCIRLQSLDSPRGLILDRNGKLLVDNRPSFDLFITIKDADPLGHTIEKLSKYLQIPADQLEQKINSSRSVSSYKPVLLKQDIGRDALAVIEAHKYDIPGIFVSIKPLRHYIYKEFAAHLIGYLGEISTDELKNKKYSGYRAGDFIGKFGIEKTCERLLNGIRGGQQVEVNAKGQVIRVLKTVNPKPGYNIYLTIDLELQKKAEELIKDKAGAVVAMDPETGQILALASAPSFDQNDFVSGMSHKKWDSLVSNPFRPMENKVIQGKYPPASTYKIVTAMAGLEEGIIDENTVISCPGYYRYGDRTFRCWKRGGHGSVNIYKALSESCDVFFYQVGQKLGIERLAWYAKACGLGSLTGIDLLHEEKGLVPTTAWKRRRKGVGWQSGETLSVAIGQGYNLATPLQMLVLISAVANGGVRYKPLVLKKVKTAENESIYKFKKEIIGRLPVSNKSLKIIKKGLWKVVNDKRGTAKIVHVDGIDICGKTGTAQVVSLKKGKEISEGDGRIDLRPHAWFVAYAPSDNPKIAISVIVEHGEHGSSTAGPIARELIKAYLFPAS